MKIIRNVLRKIMLRYKRLLYYIAQATTKVDNHMIVFEAFQGRKVACSPKALYEELISNPQYSQYKAVWSLRDTNRDDLINNRTKIVKFDSFSHYRALAKAKYWITNSNPRYFIRPKKNQIFVQTWHGTPLKKIGCDVEKKGNAATKFSDIRRIYVNESKKISYMVSPSNYCTEKFCTAFNLIDENKKDAVITLGYPRNDYLFKYSEEECIIIKEKLGIKGNKKVILYAPTFRDDQYSATTGFKIQAHMDFSQAYKQLGDEYVILFRAHYFISGRLDLSKYKDFVYDVSNVEDINELYIISDLLITDYSSVFFDYANLHRPVVFFMSDYERYRDELRDFYFDVNELPGPIVMEQANLFEKVKEVIDGFEPDEKYKAFNDKYNYLDGPEVSKKVLQQIIK